MLDEMYYSEMLRRAKIKILPTKDYTPLLKAVVFQGVVNTNTMSFLVNNNYNGWMNYIQFPEWQEQVEDLSMTPMEAARILLAGSNCRIGCGCPSYLFHGYQYIETQLDAAIIPEDRFPSIRNPHLLGFCCKHLRKSLTVMAFHLTDMASAIKKQRLNLPAPVLPS